MSKELSNTINENNTPILEPKKTRKEMQDAIRKEKALIKATRKAWFRKKTEKKLAEKAERKIAHKRDNAKRKLEKKIQAKTPGWVKENRTF